MRETRENIIPDNIAAIDVFLQPYILNTDQLLLMVDKLWVGLQSGLSDQPDVYNNCSIKMLPTHVTSVPDATDGDKFYSIDMGGTKLRFLEISIINGELIEKSSDYAIPHNLMTGKGVDLFDFIASCIFEGFKNSGIMGKPLDCLGFTFSFPVNQIAIDCGILTKWGKGFTASGVVGQDIVKLLREACELKNLRILHFILINDTTGALLNGAFLKKATNVGVINGTGTNACYFEEIEKVQRWKSSSHTKRVIINTEWGAFGENGEIDELITPIDRKIDASSVNPGKQIFEKMISGMFLGEAARLIIIQAAERGLILNNGIPPGLYRTGSFETSMISLSYNTKRFICLFLSTFGYNLDKCEYYIISMICDVVSRRSADLLAAGLVAILMQISCPENIIAADGSVFKKHPHYLNYVLISMDKLISDKIKFDIISVDGGSGKGAALAACMASKKLMRHIPNK
ncbi:hypothetical protein MXB_5324 [Myxobolus squamalis]|nr:hypothetical protein MXB_5324 [Myxobolus squamalis]